MFIIFSVLLLNLKNTLFLSPIITWLNKAFFLCSALEKARDTLCLPVFFIVEFGPGDGSLMRTLIQVFKNFPEFNKKKKIYLFEISNFMKKLQNAVIVNIKY